MESNNYYHLEYSKQYEYNNKDEVNRTNILSDNNYQISSQKFRPRK